MIRVQGRVNGLYNKDTKQFEVKRGVSKTGKRYQTFEISVSSKQEDGTYKQGKGLKVFITGDTKIEANTTVGIEGYLVPDNYTNGEGKEVRGNMIMAKCEDMFEPIVKSKQTKEATNTVEDAW